MSLLCTYCYDAMGRTSTAGLSTIYHYTPELRVMENIQNIIKVFVGRCAAYKTIRFAEREKGEILQIIKLLSEP